jgi:hypothetical protein
VFRTCKGFRMTAPSEFIHEHRGRRPKASRKEPAGSWARCRTIYGDFDVAVGDGAADDVARRAIGGAGRWWQRGSRRPAAGGRRRSGLYERGEIQARTNASPAGLGPARPIGTATANDVARAHEVSILMAAGIAVGLCRGGSPALNTSMMRMAEPHHGHGLGGVAG